MLVLFEAQSFFMNPEGCAALAFTLTFVSGEGSDFEASLRGCFLFLGELLMATKSGANENQRCDGVEGAVSIGGI